MPFASNPLDGIRIYFEDDGGEGPPVVLHGGLLDTTDLVRESTLAQALPDQKFRKIFVDHRGLGRSDKPHASHAYRTALRVADVTAVLDEISVPHAHFIGTSWGGRLGFGIGEHAPDRVLSLVIGGQQPYAIDPGGPLAMIVGDSLSASITDGTEVFVHALETFSGMRFPPESRRRYLTHDPSALYAAWKSAVEEGDIAVDLTTWRLPCLIFVGAADDDFQDQARRAAGEIPDAEFIAVESKDHLGAHFEHDEVIPAMLDLLRRHP